MSLQAAITAIQGLADAGTMPRYAIAGSVAASFYLEPASTFDLDILVAPDAFQNRPGYSLMTLDPIRNTLANAGYGDFRKEGIMVEGWPVQFLPAESPLDIEALDQARDIAIAIDPPTTARVLRAEHVMAIALNVGRAKDHLRVTQFIQENAFDPHALKEILYRHGLTRKWLAFCEQTGVRDPSVINLASRDKP